MSKRSFSFFAVFAAMMMFFATAAVAQQDRNPLTAYNQLHQDRDNYSVSNPEDAVDPQPNRVATRRPVRGYALHSFDSPEACLAALERGEYYEPSYFSDARKAPPRPVAFTRGLEAGGCALMKVVGGSMRWVPQRAGVLVDYDANRMPIRRHDCGNAITEIVYPQPPQPAAPPTGCIDILKEGYDWNNTRLSVVPSVRIIIDGSHSVATDSAGRAKFVGVPAGTHTLTEEIPEGWEQYLVTPAGGQVEVAAGDQCSGVVFKNRQLQPPPPERATTPAPPPPPPPQVAVVVPPVELFPVPPEEKGPGYCSEGNPHHLYAWPWVQVRCHPVRTGIVLAATCAIVGGVWGVGPCEEIHELFEKKEKKTWPKPNPDAPYPGGK